jgi:hypothetical protein
MMVTLVLLAVLSYLLVGVLYMLAVWLYLNPVRHDLAVMIPIVLVWPIMAIHAPWVFWTEAWKARRTKGAR